MRSHHVHRGAVTLQHVRGHPQPRLLRAAARCRHHRRRRRRRHSRRLIGFTRAPADRRRRRRRRLSLRCHLGLGLGLPLLLLRLRLQIAGERQARRLQRLLDRPARWRQRRATLRTGGVELRRVEEEARQVGGRCLEVGVAAREQEVACPRRGSNV